MGIGCRLTAWYTGLEVWVLPAREGARSIWWYERCDEVVLGVGEEGGRWEFAADDDGLAFLEDVVRSTIAGRITEVLAPGRSRVVVVLADGSHEAETGYGGLRGCLPIPFWRRWSREIRYLPYR